MTRDHVLEITNNHDFCDRVDSGTFAWLLHDLSLADVGLPVVLHSSSDSAVIVLTRSKLRHLHLPSEQDPVIKPADIQSPAAYKLFGFRIYYTQWYVSHNEPLVSAPQMYSRPECYCNPAMECVLLSWKIYSYTVGWGMMNTRPGAQNSLPELEWQTW